MTKVLSESPATDARHERYLVVTVDSHCGPMPAQLREYCDAGHLADFDDWAAGMRSEHDQLQELLKVPEDVAAFARATEDTEAERPPRYTEGNTDIHERLRHMNGDGIVAEVIFHGGQNGQLIPFNDFALLTEAGSLAITKEQLDLRTAGYQIYNRWLADWVSVEPERHVGVAHVPFWDIDAAVREVEAARATGLRSVNFPALRDELAPYNDPCWEPIWSACELLEMPLSSHGGNAIGKYQGVESIALMLMEVPFFGRRALWYLIFGGVFERHPRLKYVITEQRWDDEVLVDMDSAYLADPTDPDFPSAQSWAQVRKQIPLKPSEYFTRNCFIGASMLSHREARAAIDTGLSGNVMWGSDYPHMEGTWPHTRLSLRKTFAGLPVDATARMLGGNAIEVYGLDRATLQAIADRIGPTVAELDEPLETPAELKGTWGFREVGKWS